MAVALAGCGSSSSNSAASNDVVRAAFVSTGSSGYQMNFSLQVGSAVLPTPITGTGTGSINVPTHSGSLSLDMNLGSSPAIRQVLGTSTLHLAEVIQGTTFYVKLPAAITSKVPSLGAKPWIKIDLAKAASAAGVPGLSSLINDPTSSDPSQFLQYLRAAGTVTKQGSAVVNGVQTTQYHAEINLDRVSNAVPASSRAAAKQAIAGLEKVTKLHQIPVDVWIDAQHLVRRIKMAFSESLPTGQSVSTGLTVDFVKYGPQPSVPAPPASQVTDASGLSGISG